MAQEPPPGIPREITEVIATHRLGRFRTSYKPRTFPRGLLGSTFFIVLGLFFSLGSFLVLGTGSFFLPLLIGLVLLGIGLLPLVAHFLKRSWHVYLCNEGLISTRKGHTDVIRWDEVTIVQVDPGVSYTLHRTDGKIIPFNDTLRDVKNLGEFIVKNTTRYLFPQVLTTYAAGSAVVFGQLSVNQQGLSKGKETLPWNQVKSIQTVVITRGRSRYPYLVIRQKGKPLRPWVEVPVAAMPNYLLFCELTEQILTTSQEGTPSPTAPRPESDSTGGRAPLSSDVQSQFPSVSGASNQEESDLLSSGRDLTATLAHLGVVLDWEESDPETALRGGLAKSSLALAWEEYTAGQFDKVITDMTALINDANLQDNPRCVSACAAAYYVRGLAYEKQGNLTQASQDFASSGHLVPNYEPTKQAWERVGELYRQSRHTWLESTLAQLGVVLEVSKSDPDALVTIQAKTDLAFAWKEYSEGKFVDKSIESATRLINDANLQDNPRFVSVYAAAYYIRGLAHEKQGNKAQAILDFQSALQLVPDYELAKQAWERLVQAE